MKVGVVLLFGLFGAFHFFEKNEKIFGQNSMYLFGTLDPHPPTANPILGQSRKKTLFFFTIFGALKHHEMARYDIPPYVVHVLGHFWMFAVKITEWLFSLKSLGLWTHLWTHLPIVWDKVPNKSVFFTPSHISKKKRSKISHLLTIRAPPPPPYGRRSTCP